MMNMDIVTWKPNMVLQKSVPSPANEFAARKSLNAATAGQIQSLESDFASVGAVSNFRNQKQREDTVARSKNVV
jgi:hypothetical protein